MRFVNTELLTAPTNWLVIGLMLVIWISIFALIDPFSVSASNAAEA